MCEGAPPTGEVGFGDDAGAAAEPSTVETMIAALKAEGRVDSEGHFGLDRARAREQMARFMLGEPELYVQQLVQAAVLKGAERIQIDVDSNDLRLRFDGEPFTREELEQLYPSLFERGDAPGLKARRELALGVNAALSLDTRYVRVFSSDGTTASRLESRPGREDWIDEPTPAEAGTTVHVRTRFGPKVLVRAIRSLGGGEHPLEKLLRVRLRYAGSTIELTGERISQGFTLPDAHGVVPIAVPARGIEGVAGFDPWMSDRAEARIVCHGVWIRCHRIERAPPGFAAIVSSDHWRKDISQSDVVRDAAYQAVVAAVECAKDESTLALAREVRDDGELLERGQRRAWALAICRHAIRRYRHRRQFRPRAGDRVAVALAELGLWMRWSPDGSSRPISLNEIFQLEAYGRRLTWVPREPKMQYKAVGRDEVRIIAEEEAEGRHLEELLGGRIRRPRARYRDRVLRWLGLR